MALISAERLEMERQQHAGKYGVDGYRWRGYVARFAQRLGATTILDYGAGKGTLGDSLPYVTNYDPVTFPDDPSPADLVVCTDVLEFVEDVSAVLLHINGLARKGVFFVVPQHPYSKYRPGLTIKPLESWERLLSQHWPHYSARVVGFDRYSVGEWTGEGTPRLVFEGVA